jgi:hypothetical protein
MHLYFIEKVNIKHLVKKIRRLWEFQPNREEGTHPFIFHIICVVQLLRLAQKN